MPSRHIYLDNSATTRPTTPVMAAMELAMTDKFGNPSSAHSRGEASRRLLEHSRAHVARLIGVPAEAVFFTSGATEANNIAIRSCALSGSKRVRVVTTTVEHSSVLKLCQRLEQEGVEVIRLAVDSRGLIYLRDLSEALSTPTDLLTVQWVNSETGVIQPIDEIARIARLKGVPLHVDAAQAIGKLRISVADLPIDYVSVTAHKIHGPQGVGALYVRPGRAVRPLLWGGPQEGGRRPGTENVPGIAGFGVAAELRSRVLEEVVAQTGHLRESFERRLQARLLNVGINGSGTTRVSSTTNIHFAGVDGQALVARLDQEGVYCSQSSACTNQRPEPSYVLRAMGLSEEEAYSCVRFTFSELNTFEETQEAADIVIGTVEMLRGFEGSGAFAA